jgi:hypothetical protein
MKANGLMKGNYIDFNGTIAKILEIRENHARIEYIRSDSGCKHSPLIEFSKLKGIEINTVILELKCGFEKIDKNMWENGFSIHKKDGIFWFSTFSELGDIELSCIHNVQNLYRCLLGVELEITN